MKEKIIEICKIVEIHIQKSKEYQACIGTGHFTERFNEIIPVIKALISAEVDRRIAERLPSEDEIEEDGREGGLRDGELQMFWEGGMFIRSRMTEGGGK